MIFYTSVQILTFDITQDNLFCIINHLCPLCEAEKRKENRLVIRWDLAFTIRLFWNTFHRHISGGDVFVRIRQRVNGEK